MMQVEWLVALTRQILFGSTLDQSGIGTTSGAGEDARRDGLKQFPPPLRELLWGEGRRFGGVCGAWITKMGTDHGFPMAIIKLVQQQPQTYRFEQGESLRITKGLPDGEARVQFLRELLDGLGTA
jgi:hypothetical protein